jgi:hypothetical protein
MNEMTQERKLSTADLVHPDNEQYETEAEQVQHTDVETEQVDMLFEEAQTDNYQNQWMEIQTMFVDEPRTAVKEADGLVAEVIKGIAELFADERARLETQWSQGEDVDTEALRQILKRYRSFFRRLLAI